MEKLESSLVNIDFEESLKSEDFSFPKWKKINRELEYLYFWDTDSDAPLWTKEDFSKEYTDYVSNLVGLYPQWTSSGAPSKLWWGQLNNKDEFYKQKKINSKVIASLTREKLGINPFSSFVCENNRELEKTIRSFGDEDYVIKENFCFSGRGLHFKEYKNIDFPVVAELWKKRVRDFSLFERDGEVQCIQSQVNHNGTFKGSIIKPDVSERRELVEKFQEIREYYQREYDAYELQLDSYQFLDDSRLEFQFLGEVNHRRTLGTIFYELHKKLGGSCSFLAIIPSHQMKVTDHSKVLELLGNIGYNPVTKSGVVCLSPADRKLNLFFITEESERLLQFLVRDFWKAVVHSKHRLPPEFIVYL